MNFKWKNGIKLENRCRETKVAMHKVRTLKMLPKLTGLADFDVLYHFFHLKFDFQQLLFSKFFSKMDSFKNVIFRFDFWPFVHKVAQWAPMGDLTKCAKIYLWVCSFQKYVHFWWCTSRGLD